MVKLNNSWDDLLAGEFRSEYYLKLREILKREYKTLKIYPDMYDIFNALRYTDYEDVKVVILGQDPYHGEGQAHGLAFSVKRGVPAPPSLVNIFKEIVEDTGGYIPDNGCLIPWAEQGVLLLNAALTVRAGAANSHQNIGWSIFTDKVVSLLNDREKPIVFMLWGGNAKRKGQLITNDRHVILTAAHPSPLSAYGGFFGCRHFSKANEYIKGWGGEPIDWQIRTMDNAIDNG